MTDIRKARANALTLIRSTTSLSMVFVTEFIIREGKERGSLQGQWICSRKRMRRRTRTVDGMDRTLARAGSESQVVVVVNKINNNTNQRPHLKNVNIYFCHSLESNHVIQHQTARPKKISPPRLRCPGKIQWVALPLARLAMTTTASPQEMQSTVSKRSSRPRPRCSK